MKLFCAIVGGAGPAFSVRVDESDTVDDLKKAIKAENRATITCDAKDLQLFRTDTKGEWLTEADVENGVGTTGLTLLKPAGSPLSLVDLTEDIVRVELTKDLVQANKTPVHVLVVLPKRPATDRDEDMPPAKRAKADQVEVPYQGPVPEEFYSVPMETIDTYQKLQAAFLSRTIAPLCLLYGPRQFGKTTIGLRLRTLLAAEPSIRVIYISLTPSDAKTEEDFWLALSRTVGEETRSSEEFDMMFSCHKRRLWLAIDEMDNMFQNEELTSNFMETLREWQAKKYFVGFLGIGTHDLLNIHTKLKGGSSASPFNLGEVFQAKPFSKKQMKGYFKQIQARYPFRKSTRKAIMAYSAGAPGVFGSSIRYSIDCAKCDQERHEWEHWFKIQNFSNYLETRNWTYGKIRMDLQKLGQADWDLLSLLLKDTASEAREDFGASREKLLQMGVVIDCQGTTELKFSSQMMRRLCFEALPIREIRGVAPTDDPLELLAVSLRFMNPESIRHVSVKKKLSPSESVFQFELYAAIRGIFAANYTADKHVLPEVRDPYDPQNRRLDIIISNGKKYGYELKADQLNEADIVAAVRQADGYRQLLNVDVMFVVNFIPQGHTLRKQVFKVETYSDVQVIHVFFPDTCDEYTLQHQDADGTIKDRTVCCGGRAKALPSFS